MNSRGFGRAERYLELAASTTSPRQPCVWNHFRKAVDPFFPFRRDGPGSISPRPRTWARRVGRAPLRDGPPGGACQKSLARGSREHFGRAMYGRSIIRAAAASLLFVVIRGPSRQALPAVLAPGRCRCRPGGRVRDGQCPWSSGAGPHLGGSPAEVFPAAQTLLVRRNWIAPWCPD